MRKINLGGRSSSFRISGRDDTTKLACLPSEKAKAGMYDYWDFGIWGSFVHAADSSSFSFLIYRREVQA